MSAKYKTWKFEKKKSAEDNIKAILARLKCEGSYVKDIW